MEFIEIKKGDGNKFGPSIVGGALILFFSNGCGHCTSMKPEWNNLKKKLNELQRDLRGVNIVSVNSDAAGELDSEWHDYARRVPTIIAVDKKGKKHDYNKERKTEEFVEFMKEILSNTPQKGGKKRKKTKRRKKTNMRKSKRSRKSKKVRKTRKTKKGRKIKREQNVVEIKRHNLL